MKNLLLLLFVLCLSACSEFQENSPSQTLNGSYSKMLIIDSYLYAVNDQELTSYNISNSENPIKLKQEDLGFNIENITYNNGLLLIGSRTTMYIFEIGGNGIPFRKSTTNYFVDQRVMACDPVLAKEHFAYVTLNTFSIGNCVSRAPINELRVYNITDFENPTLVSTTEMEAPKGLAIDGDFLFVCEAINGFKVFSIEDPNEIKLLHEYGDNKESYDVIAADNLLTIVSPVELRQYDYSEIQDIKFLSRIDL